VHRFSSFSDCTCSLPITELFYDITVTLPMYASLTEGMIAEVSNVTKTSFESIRYK